MSPLSPDELRARIAGLSVWKRGGQRAPHKPLLLLYGFGQLAQGIRDLPFSTVEPALKSLLREFGPPRKAYHPEYPFWWLQTDALWDVEADELVMRAGHNAPTLTSLRTLNPVGRLPEEVTAPLHAHPGLVGELAHLLLGAHFPTSLHREILDAVSLDLELTSTPTPRRRRDPAFREAVLRAYGYRCAVCGFDTRVGDTLVGIDAAHVMWHQTGAARVDDVTNGLALCVLHHRLLDRGAFTLASASSSETVVEVAETAHGGPGFERWLLDFHGQAIARPVSATYRVAEPSVAWHRREVFRGPARERAGE